MAATRPTPPDWCYVHNFEDARKPKLLELPAGTGERLRRELEKLAEEVRTVLATALESDEYQTRRQIVDEEYKTLTEKLFGEVEEEARKRGLALLRTPMGVAFAPLKENGEIAPPEEFQKLPEEERKRIQQNVEELQEQLRKSLDQAPRWERERQERLRQLNDEVVEAAIRPLIDELKSHYEGHANVLAYLDAVRQDVIEKHADILQAPPPTAAGPQRMADLALRRYHVNVLVDNGATRGAPVIYENNPTYANLVGRVEHVAREGVLTTDFTLIKPGALHRANGGYLILDARRMLQQPFAYDALKRALQSGEVRIESPARGLEPDHHHLARARAGAARRQGGAHRRAAALLPAHPVRPRLREAVQGRRRPRRRDRSRRRRAALRAPGGDPGQGARAAAVRPLRRRARDRGERADDRRRLQALVEGRGHRRSGARVRLLGRPGRRAGGRSRARRARGRSAASSGSIACASACRR